MRYASKRDSNIDDAGGGPAAAVAGPVGSGDEFAPGRGAAGTDKSDSGEGEKLRGSGRIRTDHGRIAALRRESDHSDIARERRYVTAVGASTTGRSFSAISRRGNRNDEGNP